MRITIRRIAPIIPLALALGVSPSGSHASQILELYAQSGSGTQLSLLSVQGNGRATSEFGSITYDGSDDVEAGDAKNQSRTRTVAELTAAGIGANNFGVSFDINEADDDVVLGDFSLVFQDDSGSTLFTSLYDAPEGGQSLAERGAGPGESDYLFRVTFTASEVARFFGVATNRVGQVIRPSDALADISGGAEDFAVVRIDAIPSPAIPNPEPSTIALAVSALPIGLVCWWRRRKAATA